jgi:transposase-like protein
MTEPKTNITPDWAAIRHAYEQGDDSIRDICSQFGVSKGQLEYHNRRDHWTPRQPRDSDRREATRMRLFALLERQVVKLANAPSDTLGDKEAQQLTELVKTFDKMANMADAESKVEIVPQRRTEAELRERLVKRIVQYGRR